MAQKFLTYGFVFLLLWAGNGFGQDRPKPPIISYITIESIPNNPGAVRLYWEYKDTIPIYGFIIFRYDEFCNWEPCRMYKVPPTTFEYLDSTATANTNSERYYISAIGAGPESDPSNTAATIFLEPIQFNICEQKATLNWSRYVGWPPEEDGYKVKRNGVFLQKYNYMPDTTFVDSDIKSDSVYDYFIVCKNKNSGYFTYSNRISKTFPSFIKPNPDSLYINQVTNHGSEVEILAKIDTSADLIGHQLYFGSSKEGTYDTLPINKNLSSENLSFTHTNDGTPLYYKVAALDNCKHIAGETQHVKPLQLAIEMLNYDVTLTWDTSFVDAMETYEVFVSIDAAAVEPMGKLNEHSLAFNLNDLGTETSENFCFYVVASDDNGFTSTSQSECISRTPIVEIPDAFSPNGDVINDYFGPFVNSGKPEKSYIKDVTVTEFKLYVYDRYGGIMFYTEKSYEFWDGTIKGVSVSEGGYVYYYTYTTSLGKSYKGSGAINVVYP